MNGFFKTLGLVHACIEFAGRSTMPTTSARRHSRFIAVGTLVTLSFVAPALAPAANPPTLPAGAIAPTEAQRALARRLGTILEEAHFRHARIDDRMSARAFDRYLDSLDGQRSYFLASDIADFAHYRLQFDDMIHTGKLEPAYVMLARLQGRNRQRIQYALTLLDTEPDWTIDESFEFERDKAPWAANTAAMNELWRKRVKSDALSLLLTGKSWSEAADILRKRYQRVLKRIDQISQSDVFESLMNAYAHAFDPHSNYFSPRSSEEYRIQMSLNYEGIGASLALVDDYVTVTRVLEGGPAFVAGTLKPNDRIIGVAQGTREVFTDVVGWRLDDVVQLIRGKAGTSVRLQVLPAGAAPGSQEKTFEFVRNKVSLDAQAARKEVRTLQRGEQRLKIGVITVPSFYRDTAAQSSKDKEFRSTTRDVSRLLKELSAENIDGLIIDLRNNGGGYLPEATALTGLFIDKGPIVQLKDTPGRIEVLEDPIPGTQYDGPLTVLVNRLSASASEIFAGAIQDYQRGLVLGQRTFGKGTVQNLVPLDPPTKPPVNGQFTITIGKFYRITGESTQHRGIEPDVSLASPIDTGEVGESALDAALPWDHIARVAFQPANRELNAITPMLAREQARRAESDPDYRRYLAGIAAQDAQRGAHRQSLNLAVRRDERARAEKERADRENAWRATRQLPRVSTVAEIETAEFPDAMLAQAAEITADLALNLRSGVDECFISAGPSRTDRAGRIHVIDRFNRTDCLG
jgi:carboxyl-terminal processing protease